MARRRELLERLPYAKRLVLESRSAEACTASLAALVLLEHALACIEPVQAPPWPRLSFPGEAKPTLAGGPSFSLSHSAGRVVCAVASTGEVGVDVEEPDARRNIDALRDWTAREATLKASGVGLRGWRDVVFEADTARVGGQRYCLRELQLGGDSIAHLALDRPFGALQVEAAVLD